MKNKLFICFQYLVPQHLLSRIMGRMAASKNRGFKNLLINKFIKQYAVNMAEARYPNPQHYPSFNHFFTRELKPGSRPFSEDEAAIICPADGLISACGNINEGRLIQAKGKTFSLVNLLGGKRERAEEFEEGNFATVYLSPKDYHRVHMPFSGTLKEMVYIPGQLFSVNQATSENIPELFARNERVVCIFDTEIGSMAVVLVGAMIVASIETVWAGQITPSKKKLYTKDYSEQLPPIHIQKGDEVGRFKLGSTAIILFAPGTTEWSGHCRANMPVQMGQTLAKAL